MPNPYDTVIGFDCSLTDTGIVVIERAHISPGWDVREVFSSLEFAKFKDPLRQVLIVQEACRIMRKARNAQYRVAVVIEDYAFGSRTGKILTRAELGGMIKYQALATFGFDVFLVTPKSVKKFMGSGKLEKNDMAMAAKQRYGFVHMNENVVDAFCLCRYLVANQEGQMLTLVKHTGLPQYSGLQVPAKKDHETPAARPLTISRSKPNLPKLATRRLRIPRPTIHQQTR